MQAEVGAVHVGFHVDAVFHLVVDVGAQVVPQALPHAGRFLQHRNAELLQLVPGADARQHQQLGRPDGPGG